MSSEIERVVLITGATGGLGRVGVAELFARDGARRRFRRNRPRTPPGPGRRARLGEDRWAPAIADLSDPKQPAQRSRRSPSDSVASTSCCISSAVGPAARRWSTWT